ncbi:ATP-binding protein [Candidatus Bathyarchaeota archaeon]|nr:ATP-binding protein [Candidatus Bathyarchaeota archaeon]
MNEVNLKTRTLGSILGQGRRSNEILVVSSVQRTGTLRKGAMLAHTTSNETILLQLTDKITWTDISEQDLQLMSENERMTYRILQNYPKSFVLRCALAGVIRDEGEGPRVFSEPISFLADETSEVRHLTTDEQKLIFDRGSLYVGNSVDGSQVTFPINGLLQRHLSIIGMTGSGKSYLVGVLCEELAKHKAAIFIVDPHSEYIPMAQSLPQTVKRKMYGLGSTSGLSRYTIDVRGISAYDFQHFTGMGEGSTSILAKVIQNLRKTESSYSMSDILTRLNSIAEERTASEAIAATWARNYLRNLADSGYIGTSEPRIEEIAGVNQISVIGMSGVKERIQQFLVTNILQRIFEARKQERIPPVIVIIEEAHRFAPSGENSPSTAAIRTLATEGRKFGICLVVVTQRPNRLDSTVLSQCVTNIVMKVKNPSDLNSIKLSAENITDDLIDLLPRFEKGEAVVMGEAFPISIRFRVRSERKTEHGGKSVDFENHWAQETSKTNKKRFEFPDEL